MEITTMADGSAHPAGASALERRVVRYADLKPCLNAFIDTRSPGSEEKENFSVIGPGVSENPDQHVHIAEPHGFNIGGARQPPGCLNSQHSHTTAETIVVHSGRWRFDFGETGQDAQVTLSPGDVLSAPTEVFRGFTNVGDEAGYLFFILGEDDPGRVTWAPRVFELARDFGLVLMADGSLVDTAAGQAPSANGERMPATTAAEVAKLRRLSPAAAEAVVVRDSGLRGPGETSIIGPGAPLDWPHGFTLARRDLAAGEALAAVVRDEPEVVFVQSGSLDLACDGLSVTLGPGDTVTLPRGSTRSMSSAAGACVFVVRGGDRPTPAHAV